MVPRVFSNPIVDDVFREMKWTFLVCARIGDDVNVTCLHDQFVVQWNVYCEVALRDEEDVKDVARST